MMVGGGGCAKRRKRRIVTKKSGPKNDFSNTFRGRIRTHIQQYYSSGLTFWWVTGRATREPLIPRHPPPPPHHPPIPPLHQPQAQASHNNLQYWKTSNVEIHIYIYSHNNFKKFHEHIEGFRQIQWWRECYVCNIRMAKNSFKGNKFEHQCVWHIKEVSARHDQNCNSIEVGQTFQKPKNLFFWKILKIDIFSEIRYESQLGLVA